MAQSRRNISQLFSYKRKVGHPHRADDLLERVEYYYPRIHGFICPKVAKGAPPLLRFEVDEIRQAVKQVARLPMEAPSRWAERIVANLVNDQDKPYRSCGTISGGRVRNLMSKARKTKAGRSNPLDLVSDWIRNGEVEVPIDVTG